MSAAKKAVRVEYNIQVSSPSGPVQSLSFDRSITIGRAAENDIVISNDPKVSRKHVALELSGTQIKIINLSPKNAIQINGSARLEYILNEESAKITLGDSQIEVKNTPNFGRAEPVPLQVLTPLQPLAPSVVPIQPVTGGKPAAATPKKAKASPKKLRQTSGKKNRMPLILTVIILAVGGFLLMEEEKPAKEVTAIRSAQDRQEDLARAQMQVDELSRAKKQSGQTSKMYESAQGYYVRGFRDYRLGQFRRAMQAFQAALSFYPDHVLARKYLQMAEVQADKIDRLNIQQGRKYKSRGNYSLCASSFQKVMASIKDPENAVYKEAKVFYDTCNRLAEDKY